MRKTAVIVAHLFGYVGGMLLIALTLSLSGSAAGSVVHGRVLYLLVATALCLAISSLANIAKDLLPTRIPGERTPKSVQPLLFKRVMRPFYRVFVGGPRMIHMAFMKPFSFASALRHEVTGNGIDNAFTKLVTVLGTVTILSALGIVGIAQLGFRVNPSLAVRFAVFALSLAVAMGACLGRLIGWTSGVISGVSGLALGLPFFAFCGAVSESPVLSLGAFALLAFVLGSVLGTGLVASLAEKSDSKPSLLGSISVGLLMGCLLGAVFALIFDIFPRETFGAIGNLESVIASSLAAILVFITAILSYIIKRLTFTGIIVGCILSLGVFLGVHLLGRISGIEAFLRAIFFLAAFTTGYYRLLIYFTEALLFSISYLFAKLLPLSARELFLSSPVFADEAIWFPLPFLRGFLRLADCTNPPQIGRDRLWPGETMLGTYISIRAFFGRNY